MYPTPWQRKTLWTAVTCVSLLVITAVVFFALYVLFRVVFFLQPLLLPFAVAGVLAYLLEPLVSWLARRGLPRLLAVVIVFAVFITGAGMIVLGVGPSIYRETESLTRALPGYFERTWSALDTYLADNLEKLPKLGPKTPDAIPSASPNSSPAVSPTPSPADSDKGVLARYQDNPYVQQSLQYINEQLPGLAQRLVTFVQTSITGVFGAFGFIFGFFVIPVYLFFFLKESPRIASSWTRYLPVRKSVFKDELVGVLTEINGYIINFFRGQLVVSMIDGVLTAIGLSILGLHFGFLIGIILAVAGIIPYVGFAICYVCAVLVAFVQFNDWVHPLWVSIIFLIVQQIDGMILAPRIVGNSVGLHPLTVIFSVFFWSLLLGLLGAVLAIPLTATVKVLLRRYVWERQRSFFFDERETEREEPAIEIAT
ncbi:MAG: AI-2E family transporter [Verrucomicrobia bacterium]|nr:AI-2E family transporter [Verrucomicrobiota bacterium]